MDDRPFLVGVVGPCAAGKTTLTEGLKRAGVNCRHIAQEHSYVPAMWKKITNPDVLIYLEVSYPTTIQRRQLNWTLAEYQEQLHRLRHARENASLVIQTDELTAAEVLQVVLSFIG
jgi:deoxyadenosine/deoxycytidine kinase